MSGYIPLFGASGNSLNYAMLRSLTTGQVWNGASMEAWNIAHWATYIVAAPEQPGSSAYIVAVPGALPADTYKAVLYTPVGGSPTAGDTPIEDEVFSWDGGNIINLGSGVNVLQINGSAPAAVNLAKAANAYVVGAAVAGTLTTSQMTTNLAITVADQITGRTIIFTSGQNAGRTALITAYAVTGGRITMIAYGNKPISSAPVATDTFIVL